jgi:hypothetical protein
LPARTAAQFGPSYVWGAVQQLTTLKGTKIALENSFTLQGYIYKTPQIGKDANALVRLLGERYL